MSGLLRWWRQCRLDRRLRGLVRMPDGSYMLPADAAQRRAALRPGDLVACYGVRDPTSSQTFTQGMPARYDRTIVTGHHWVAPSPGLRLLAERVEPWGDHEHVEQVVNGITTPPNVTTWRCSVCGEVRHETHVA